MLHGDPIATLVEALDRHGKPPLAWVVAWSNDGREPVEAAWEVSEDPWAMVQLLMRSGRDWPLGRYHLVDGTGLRKRDSEQKQYVVLGDGAATSFLQRDAAGAQEIRRRIPRPPSLDVLMSPQGNRTFRMLRRR